MRGLLLLDKRLYRIDDEQKKIVSLQNEVEEAIKQDYYLSCRFPEYGRALKHIRGMMLSPAYSEMWDAHLDDAKRINSDNRTAKKRQSSVSEPGFLTQCIFCYRFHLQNTRGRNTLSKYCSDHEKTFDNWGTYLLLKNTEFKQSDVYRDGFYRYSEL